MEPSPEVRQNLTPDADQFGSVAVKAGPDRWGVMNPLHGGHWATDAEVEAWAALAAPAAPAPDKQGTAAAK